MNKRCPWCGELMNPRVFQRGLYHCEHCGNKSKVFHYGWLYGVSALIGLILLLFLNKILSISGFIVFWIVYSAICIIQPLEMDKQHSVPQKKSKARFELLSDVSFLKRHIIFSEKQPFIICFVNSDNIPISHTLCITIEDVKFHSSRIFESNIKFVPLSEHNVDFNKGDRFYMFYNNEKIAFCELEANVG